MPMPGVSAEKDVKLLLNKLIENPKEVFKFAVVAEGPKEGSLHLARQGKFKRQEVLKEAKDAGRGPKLDVIVGECHAVEGSDGALRIVVQGRAAARAVACTEHLLVRGPYRSVGFKSVLLEEVEETGEEEAATTAGAEASAPVVEEEPAVAAEEAPAAAAAEDPAAAFKSRLATLLPRIKEAAGTPAGDAAKLKASEAGVLARKHDYAAANSLLDELEAGLAADPTAGQAAASRAAPATPGGAFVDYAKARLAWEATRKKVHGELRNLEKAILEDCRDEPNYAEIQKGTSNLFVMLDVLDERLGDALDAALNAATPRARETLHGAARDILDEYRDYIAQEPIFADIDDNGFLPITVRATLDASLNAIDQQLRRQGAR